MKIIHVIIVFFILFSQCIFVAQTLAEEHSITYALGDGDWHPFVYKDENGICGYEGLFIEILYEIFTNRMKMNLHCNGLPWKRAQGYVEEGKADFLLTVPTERRLEYSIQSDEPLFQLYMHVYTYKDHEKLEEIKNIKNAEDILRLGLIPVSNRGNGWHEENIDSYGIKTHYIREDEHIVKFLAAKRADIIIDAVIPLNYYIKKLGLVSEIELTDVKFGPVDFHLLLSKKSNYIELMSEFNEVIKTLKDDGTLDKMANKYMTLE